RHGVEVFHDQVSWAERLDRMNILFAAGESPDVVLTGFYSPYEEGSNGMLAPLDRYLDGWQDRHSIPDVVWDTQSWRGNVYVVPQYFDLRSFAYNKNVFAESGYDINTTP